ncbi:hypothetical protein D3C79_750770 [compost metagenome]
MGGIDGQVEAHPALAVALEALDVAGAERGGLGAGVELGGHFQVQVAQACIFVETVHGLACGLAKGRQQGEAEQQ